MAKKGSTFKVGRDAGTGRFIPVKEAERKKKTAVGEKVRKKSSKKIGPGGGGRGGPPCK